MMNNFKEWIGKEISRSDIITPRLVDHLQKTLGPNIATNDEIPEGEPCKNGGCKEVRPILKYRISINLR